MSQIVIDPNLRSKLNSGSQFCDEQGKVLGYFISESSYEKYLDAFEKEHQAGIAELDRISQEPEEGTLEELWKELGVQ
jgi:hypothetical protein